MTNKRKTAYELIIVGLSIILLALCAYMGITAVQKSMRLNVGFSAVPSIKVLIQIEDPQADGGYRTIFRNDANTQIGAGLEIHGNTLQFTNSFADSEPNIGASFVLKFTNLMTNTGLKASVIGNSATANPTYVIMKESGSGQDTATMTVSGSSALATLQLMFSEYNIYTVSFSGPSVSNATAEAGSGEAYSTTLTPKEGYNIPSSVLITVGGVAIDSNSYTYTPSTGALTINAGVVNGDVVITATATAKSYTITYDLGSNVVNHPSNPATYTVEDTITLQAPTRLFYEFTGWTESNGSTPQTSVTIPQGSTGNKTYTANWTLGNYTLMKGQDLNVAIKTELGYSSPKYSTSDRTVKSIIFGRYSDYSSTVGAWTGGTVVDSNSAGNIRMFLTNSNANCYILSDGNIYANATASSMFYSFRGLTSLTFDNFNTSNVTNMSQMFYYCTSLTELDLSSFNTSNVTNMCDMFYGCSGLVETLDLSSFNTSNVTDMYGMFRSCSGLTTIYVGSGWSTAKVISSGYMFYGCTSLVGAIAYDSSKIHGNYANWTTGYLTLKT